MGNACSVAFDTRGFSERPRAVNSGGGTADRTCARSFKATIDLVSRRHHAANAVTLAVFDFATQRRLKLERPKREIQRRAIEEANGIALGSRKDAVGRGEEVVAGDELQRLTQVHNECAGPFANRKHFARRKLHFQAVIPWSQ
jgi:hypothetical protein